ncbi:MAG: hypothetical protein CMP24_00840 [Rickettsiales bacterium]|nr:hypothetical protein [Rickettsiales bacterium]
MNYKNIFLISRLLFLAFSLILVNCSKNTVRIENVDSDLEEQEAILQKKILIEQMADSAKILHNISWPVLKKNKEFCNTSNNFSFGFLFATAKDLAPKDFPLYKKIFNSNIKKSIFEDYGTKSFPVVISIAKNSPAQDGELLENDIILEINAENTSNFRKKLSEMLSKRRLLSMKILRNGEIIEKQMLGIKICNYNIQPLPSAMPNAFADGKKIFVTLGAIKLANTVDELAFLIGHELAHNIFHYKSTGSNEALTHSIKYDDRPKIRDLKSILVYSNQRREIEADIKGLELAYRAGFDLKNVNDYWRRLSVFYPELIKKSSIYHKGNAYRASLIKKTLERIKENYEK